MPPTQNTVQGFKATLICLLVGHKWILRVKDEEVSPGYVHVNIFGMRACMRCGEPNPNFPELSVEKQGLDG